MPLFRKHFLAGLLAAALLALLAAGGLYWSRHGLAEDWPGWRGPRGDGTSLEKHVPIKWDVPKGEGIAWKTRVPGEGHSSPIVLGKRVFLTAAITDTKARLLLCLDRETGRELWRSTVMTSRLEHKHPENSFASGTPATDGERIFVTFLDDTETAVAAYDLEGHREWLVHPGRFTSQYGFSSSPVVFQDKVIVNCDQDGDSWIVALARDDGHTLWKIDRENKTRSYSTPLIRELSGRPQMVLAGDKCIASYDPRDGHENWLIDGPTDQCVASVVYNDRNHLFLATGGAPGHFIVGLKAEGQGNVTATNIAWKTTKGAAYVPSPLTVGDDLFVVSDGGVASCFNAGTGDLRWQERIGPHAHSSAVSAGGLIYLTTDDGVTTVIKDGPAFEVIAHNQLGEAISSSPAISHGHIFLRGTKHLYCFGPKR